MKATARTTNRWGRVVLKNSSAQKGRESVLPREYQAIFKNNGKPMVIVEEDATISLANDEFEKLSGYKREEIEGKKSWTEFVARNDRKRVKEYHHLRRSDPMLAPRCFEFRFLDRHGTVKNIVLTIGTIPGTQKSMASLQDVTARRRAEASLRVSEERYHTLFENSRDAFYITTSDGAYIDANHAALDLFGYTRKEMRKVNARQLYADPADARRFQKEIEKKGSVRDFEVKLRKKDGTVMDCLFTVTAQRADDGGILEYQGIVRDITERKRMEEALKESEERYRTLVEKVDFGVNLIDTEYNIVMANAEQSKRMHKPLSELIGKKCFREFEKRDAVCPHCPGVKTLASGQPAEAEAEAVRDDGSRFHVRLQTFPIFGQDGTASGFIEVIEDITERKRAEELLQQEKETFYTILQNALYGVALMEADGKHVYVNPEFTAITGYTLEDIPTGKDWMHKAYPDKAYRQKVTESWRMDSKLGGTRRVISIVCKNGETKEIETSRTPLENGLSVVMLTDITERKQMEEELRESEARFRKLVETMRVGLSAVDAKGVITYVNDQMCQMLGYTREEFIGHPTTDFHDEESRKRQEEIFAKRRKGLKDPTPYEITWVAKDGRKVNTILTPTPGYSPGGEFTGSFALFTDITERKRMEESLQESEERFKMLAENAPFGITIMAPDRTFEYLNPMFTKMFGYTKKDVPDKNTWFAKAYPDEEYRKKVSSIWKRDTAEDVRLGDENLRVFTVRCKNGQDKIIDFRSVDLKDGKQYLVYDDITDRINAEEALRESEERFRRLIETTKVGVSAIDEKGVIIYANERLSEMWGCPMDQIIRRSPLDFLDEENLKILNKHLAKRKKGERESYEITWTRKDGSKVPTILSPTPIIDTDGRYKGSYGFITDITERKQMEEALRESEERFRLLVEHSKDAILLHDFDGRIIDTNQHACESLGYTREELLSLSIQDIDEDVLPGKHQEQWKQMVPGHPITLEGVHRRKDGTTFPVEVRLGVFESGGRELMLGLVRDVTERKQAEERLKRYAAELEQTNEEVKNFAYIVSHDLRVPLVNLKGYTSELHSALEVIGPNLETALPHLNEDKRSAVAMALHEDVPEALEFITNSVSRMDSFINSVLILSRLGRRELKPEPIDMNALVQMSLGNLSHQIQERGTKVTIGSLPQVVADRTAMEQIMGNILGNAVKYLNPERPGQIEVTAETNNGEQIFHISDNGRGIAQEDMHKVFAPFRRAGKQDTQGEGMGLAYVQTLIRRLNGRIWCESELGKGTTFTFSISQLRAEGRDYVSH
jgi:PAS domain S-box-containing protein